MSYGFSGMSSGAAVGADEQHPLDSDLDDIHAYLNGAFLPAQRISQYSQ